MSILNNSLLLGADAGAAGYVVQRSLRFSSIDSAYLSRTMSSASSTYTLSMWVKRSTLASNYKYLFSSGNAGIAFYNGTDQFYIFDGGTVHATTGVYRDTSAWYHILLSVSSNTGAAYINGTQVLSGKNTASLSTTANATNIGRYYNSGSGDFYFDGYIADVYLIDGQALTPSSFTEVSATTGQLIPKQYTGSFGTNGFWLKFSDNSAATATTLGKDYSGNSNNWSPTNLSVGNESTEQPRWYSSSTLYSTKAAVVANATPRGTGSFATTSGGEYVYLVLNGGGTPGTNNVFTSNFGSSFNMYGNVGGVYTRDGSYTSSEAPLIGWTNGSFTPANYQISNTQDFYAFAASNNGGQPGNTFSSITVTALTTASFKNTSAQIGAGNDSLVDTPSSAGTDTGLGGQVTGNYCTWNPLDAHSSLTITNGNLDLSNTAGTTRNVRGTIGFPSSGKWYYEVTPGGNAQGAIGIGSSSVPLNAQNAASSVIYFEDGSKGVDASRTAYGSSYASGDVIGIAFNADTNQVTFYKNGVSQGALSTTAGVQYFPFIVTFNATYSANFGQRPFAYTAPSGFKAICDTSLPSPVVAKPDQFFQTVLWTGDNSNSRTISGLNFSPDLVWKKRRTANGDSHYFVDSVRGDNSGVMRTLFSNQTVSEQTTSSDQELQYGYISALTSSGFTVSAGSNASIPRAAVNDSSYAYVAWAFDAGTTTTTNTAGSITSTVRANPSAGFSVVSYTSNSSAVQTVGHGLNVAPAMIIWKDRDAATNWFVFHNGGTPYMLEGLNTTAAGSTSYANMNSTLPTSSVFTLNSGGYTINPAGNHAMIAYCWSPVAGYSAMGSYVGNGSSDGVFQWCGFRPRWIMIKNASSAGWDWSIRDTSRDPYNPTQQRLWANTSAAESTNDPYDILSNGFKLRISYGDFNASGNTYVWAAFAESPFQYARAR